MTSCATPVVSDSFCAVSRGIPFDGDLAIEIRKSYDNNPEKQWKIERTFRGVKNHNDVRKGLCSER